MSGFHFGYMLYMHKKSFKLKAAFNLEEKKIKLREKSSYEVLAPQKPASIRIWPSIGRPAAP